MFRVIDIVTGEEVGASRMDELRLKCLASKDMAHWMWPISACDVEGWFVDSDGNLILANACGMFVYAPHRYRVVWEDR